MAVVESLLRARRELEAEKPVESLDHIHPSVELDECFVELGAFQSGLWDQFIPLGLVQQRKKL